MKSEGPLLLACNHPNSFLDAIIIGSHFKQPIHFLARGDAFRNPIARKILLALKMIPIYRLSEGRENLALNDATFETCGEILAGNGIVLIFAEGLCVNQWGLRPLKKGAARIAWPVFNNPAIQNKFSVLPVGINYNGFGEPGKRVIIHFEKAISINEFREQNATGEFIQQFNQLLYVALNKAVLTDTGSRNPVVPFLVSNYRYKGTKNTIAGLKKYQQLIKENCLPIGVNDVISPGLIATTQFQFILNITGYIVFMLPAIIGLLGHVAFFYPLNRIVIQKTKETVFYDSVIFGMLLLLYPFYWLLTSIAGICLIKSIFIKCIIFLLPVFAYIYLFWLDCAARIGNYLLVPRRQRKIIKDIMHD